METIYILPAILNDKDRECFYLYMENIKTGSFEMCTRNLPRNGNVYCQAHLCYKAVKAKC